MEIYMNDKNDKKKTIDVYPRTIAMKLEASNI